VKLRWAPVIVALAIALGATAAYAAKIVVEAEHYKTIKPSMVKQTNSKASGKLCIGIPLRRPHAVEETGPADTGYAEYKISVSTSGLYQFWGRCRWYDACGNSFFILVDTKTTTSKTPYVTDQVFQKWHWVPGPKLRLSKGVHTIRIQNREDGAQMDQWVLTTTPKNRWEPTRLEKETKKYILK